jgi:hypothetical protein
MHIAYKLKPEHKFIHVVHANEAIHANEELMKLACEGCEAPSHWNFVKEEVECGVYLDSDLKVVLYPNEPYGLLEDEEPNDNYCYDRYY